MKIGVRQCGGLPLDQLCNWLKTNGFGAIDIPNLTPEACKTAAAAGLPIGTGDIPLSGILTTDPDKQKAAIESCKNTIRIAADNGVNILFCVFHPEDPTKGRKAAFELWKQTFPQVMQFAEEKGVKIAMEGWPGGWPYYAVLGCTPETWRAMFKEVPSPSFGLNYDPSHLVRIGVDYLRALDEFAGKVFHVHGKDTDLDAEMLYEFGNLGPTFAKPAGFGEGWWRYTIPGDGVVNWGKIVERLEREGFDGIFSIELEDWRYCKEWDAVACGLIRSRDHLAKYIR